MSAIVSSQPLPAQFDLPDAAQAKLDRLRDERDDLRALVDAGRAKLDDIRNDRDAARRELNQLERANQRGELIRETTTPGAPHSPHEQGGIDKTVVKDTERLDAAQRRVHRLESALDDAQQLQQARSERLRVLATLIERIEKFLRQSPPVALCDPIPLKKSHTIDSVRADLAALRDERKEIERAAVPASEAKDRAAQWVRARASKVVVAGLVTQGSVPSFPADGNAAAGAAGLSPVDLACWLNPDDMIAALHREIDARLEGTLSLSAVERRQALWDLEAKTLDAERIEEALIERAVEAGHDVERRADADPRAVLGVK